MKDSTDLIRFTDCYDEINGKTVRTVNPPVYSGSTVLFESYEDLHQANSGEYSGITYGTDRLPTQRIFEETLRKLEDGYLTRAFQSGISAITNPKSEIDFMQTNVSYYFNLKKQFKDQKSMSL